MTASALPWSAGRRVARVPRPGLLWGTAFVGCAAAAASFALALSSEHVAEPGLQASLWVWMALPYVIAGVIAWWRRPDSRFGPLMVGAGFATFAGALGWSNHALPFTIGQALDLLPPVVLLHVFLAFPSGRLERGVERLLVTTGYLIAVGLELVGMVLGGFGDDNLLEVAAAPVAAATLLDFQLISISALALTGVGLLAARRRAHGRPLRRSAELLVDSFALALVMIAALFVSAVLELTAFETIRRVTFGFVGLAAVAFLIGLLDARLARSAVAELVVELGSDPAPADLQDAFARALRDPSLTLVYWLPQFDSWANSQGKAVLLPADGDGSGRAATLIDRDGTHLAALVHDPTLSSERELLDAVTAAAGIALENGRLHVELRARLEELRGSRERVLRAGQQERQRLERDLHDGAQQRLIALSLALGTLERRQTTDATTRVGIEDARVEIARSLDELRRIARGLHPAVVSGHGLGVALESLAAGAAVPVRLTVAVDGRLPETVEVAAYYVVCESLANIDKHADASSATIDVACFDGILVVEIVDDGVGGADTERGNGLRGLADRVEALAGGLRIWTPAGGGTRVRAEIPCA